MSDSFTVIDHVAHGVYIGSWRATRFIDELRQKNLTHVLKLYPDEPFWPADFAVCENPFNDGEAISSVVLHRGVTFISDTVNNGNSVLVQCGAGISRSSTFVLAYLLSRNYDLRDAWQILKGCHEQANPHPTLWGSLIEHFDLPYTLEEVLHWDSN